MHNEVMNFVRSVKWKYPDYFTRKNEVLEVGSLNINGSVRKLFRTRTYLGVDLIKGPGVDLVMPVHKMLDDQFDVVISTEMLEHDIHWKESLWRMYMLTREKGIMIITCAGPFRPEHGTTRTSPENSPGTTDYYRNMHIRDFLEVLQPILFDEYQIGQMANPSDIHFYGIKN